MSYTPTSWSTGDTITAAAMNKIENGIANAGGALICSSTIVDGVYTLDKTAQEIYDALLAGTPAYIKYQYGTPSDFTGILYLAPIIKFTNYDYTSNINIYASKPIQGYVSSTTAVGIPGLLVYSAGGLDEYPTFASGRTSAVGTSYIQNAVGIE